jgi:tRNA nucleotidyltransferase/poly(A) polymerase
MAFIRREAGLIERSAGERIRDELFKLLAAKTAQPHIEAMVEVGLLSAIFPELSRLSPHHFEHSLRALQEFENLIDGFASFPADIADRLSKEISEPRSVLVKCALILHHIDPGLLRSYVDASGTKPGVLGRIRLSNRDAEHLEFLIRHRTLPFEIFRYAKRLPRDEMRFFRAAGIRLPELLLQAIAGGFSDPDLAGKRAEAFESFVHEMLRSFFFHYLPRGLLPPLLTGDDLICRFRLEPSPRFKEILDLIDEERLVRDNLTPSDAIELVRDYLARCR